MKSPLVLASLGLALGHVAATAASPRVNGWFPCAFSTFPGKPNATTLEEMAGFECADLEAPLCYDGVCESDRTINVFVKRRLGKMDAKDPKAPRKAAVLIQGGPGSASVVMEASIWQLWDVDDDSVDLYTFDHRGTGRSEFLSCDAASAQTPGSPNGTELSVDELPTCLDDLHFQYDGQAAAFSVTSAAMDVRLLIDTFLPKHDVYAIGYSYGTFLAQRLLQLKVPQIKGYIFNGVDALTTNDDKKQRAWSHWNADMVAPSRRLLEFCFDDPQCPLELTSRDTVVTEVLELLNALDKAPNECATLVAAAQKTAKASDVFRTLLFVNAKDTPTRVKGLEMLAAVQRCNADDIATLKTEAEQTPPPPAPLDLLNGMNPLLYSVIVLSERWSEPAPTKDERMKLFHATPAGNPTMEQLATYYCLFTGSTEPACQELQDVLPKSNATFFYEHDTYYDEPLTLPDHASALVINGGLDFQTPTECGEILYEKLQGSGKGVMMVTFDYGTHCAGESVLESPEMPCYDSIVRQFIQSGGDVATMNTTCMAELPTTVFHTEEKTEDESGDGEESGDGDDASSK